MSTAMVPRKLVSEGFRLVRSPDDINTPGEQERARRYEALWLVERATGNGVAGDCKIADMAARVCTRWPDITRHC
jgi:hypothetical protein